MKKFITVILLLMMVMVVGGCKTEEQKKEDKAQEIKKDLWKRDADPKTQQRAYGESDKK